MEKDFFSEHFPITVFEEYQRKHGLKKVLRPKDLAIAELLEDLNYFSSKSILDFGCAGGVWLERLLAGTRIKGYGVDISSALINKANSSPDKKGQYYISGDNWPLTKSLVDFTVSFDVFEHTKDKKREVKNIYKSLKPGGKFLFYILNPNHKFTFDWLVSSLGSDYLYKHADHDIGLFPDPLKFKKLLEKEGFTNVKYELFDGPANLFWEVLCFAYLSILDKLFGKTTNALCESLLWLNDKIIRLIFPINKNIDKLFFLSGNSNGYFIYGKKL